MTSPQQSPAAPSLGERVSDLGFAVGWSAAQHVPERVATWGVQRGADVLWRRQGPGVRQLRANLARVVGPVTDGTLDAITREGVRRYLRYWQEAFTLPSWSMARVQESFIVESGLDALDTAMSSGRGAILALPHMGNWDLAGAWAAERFGGFTTVAERLKPESLYDRFVAYRESLGMEVLPLGDPDVLRNLARRLRDGGLVCLLSDRDLAERGTPVRFFGEAASMPMGPAVLAQLTGAALFPVSTWYDGPATMARVHPELPVPDLPKSEAASVLVQQLASVYETAIREHPADWHMMQRLWHADLGRRIDTDPVRG